MSIWITLLLAILPKLLEYLIDLFSQGQTVRGKSLDQLNKVVWYTHQISETAPKVGATRGGVPPANAKKATAAAKKAKGKRDKWPLAALLFAVFLLGGEKTLADTPQTTLKPPTPQFLLPAQKAYPTTPTHCPPAGTKSARPDGKGFCTEACACGCNEGRQCRCGSTEAVSPPPPPVFFPPARYDAPPSMRLPRWEAPPSMRLFQGGGRRGG